MSKDRDYIVTAWVPIVVRVERVPDEDMAVSVAHDYLTLLDPFTGEDTLIKRLGEAVEPTVWFPGDQWGWPEMEATVAGDSEDYDEQEDHLGHRGHWDANGSGDWHCSEHQLPGCACLATYGEDSE